MPELATQRRNPASARNRRARLAAHAPKCSICRHPQRAEIERAFLDWAAPRDIAREYELGSRTTIYRHAHALGLIDRRQRELRMALGRLIEKVDDVKPTAASIVSAIRLMAKLNDKEKRAGNAEVLDEQDWPDASLPEAPAETGPANDSPSSSPPEAARAAPPATERNSALATAPAARTKPAQAKEEREAKKQSEADDYNGPPITFAQNVGPRRKFFWR